MEPAFNCRAKSRVASGDFYFVMCQSKLGREEEGVVGGTRMDVPYGDNMNVHAQS